MRRFTDSTQYLFMLHHILNKMTPIKNGVTYSMPCQCPSLDESRYYCWYGMIFIEDVLGWLVI